MIVLDKNQTNTVILRLTGVSSLLSPNYLFEFKNDLNPNSLSYFTAEDLSSFGCAYNLFEIIETSTPNPLSGQTSLRVGQYTYNIYEASAATLSVSATTGRIIETGKAIVNGTDSPLPLVYR